MTNGFLFTPRKSIITGYPKVNLAHPMAKYLAGFFVVTGNQATTPRLYNAVTQTFSGTGTNQTAVATSEGMALGVAAAQAITNTGFRGLGSRFSAAFDGRWTTVIARVRLTTLPGGPAVAVSYGSGNGGAYPGVPGAVIGFNSSGHLMGSTYGGNNWSGGNAAILATNHINEWVTAGAIHYDSETSLGATPGTARGILYKNGLRVAQGASSGAISAPSSSVMTLSIGQDVKGYDANLFTGQIAWVACFNAFLSGAEIAMFSRDPFGVLQQDSNARFMSLPEVGGALFMPRSGLNIPQAVNRASTF